MCSKIPWEFYYNCLGLLWEKVYLQKFWCHLILYQSSPWIPLIAGGMKYIRKNTLLALGLNPSMLFPFQDVKVITSLYSVLFVVVSALMRKKKWFKIIYIKKWTFHGGYSWNSALFMTFSNSYVYLGVSPLWSYFASTTEHLGISTW